MTIANGTFEEAGAEPGLAAGWVSSYVGSAEEFADFDQNPSDGFTRAIEAFEAGWAGSDDQVFVAELGGETLGTQAAVFNIGASQTAVEGFEAGWGSPPLWMPSLSALDVAQFDGGDVELFDWQPFLATLPTPTAAVFSGNPEERFEAGWGATLIASFAASGDPNLSSNVTEDFETVYAPVSFNVSTSTDSVIASSLPSVPFVDNERVRFQNVGGSLPEPLHVNVDYFVSDPSGTTFQVSQVAGGAEIDITTLGEGTHTLTRDPAVWWSRVMTTV